MFGLFVQDLTTIKWEGLWEPKLDINNTLGEAKQQIWRDVQFNASGEAFALEKRRVKGNFTERMELQEFPFDIQVHFENNSNNSNRMIQNSVIGFMRTVQSADHSH